MGATSVPLKDIIVVGRDHKSIDWAATENKITEYINQAHADSSASGKAMAAEALSRNTRLTVKRLVKRMPGKTPELVRMIIRQQAKDAEVNDGKELAES